MASGNAFQLKQLQKVRMKSTEQKIGLLIIINGIYIFKYPRFPKLI